MGTSKKPLHDHDLGKLLTFVGGLLTFVMNFMKLEFSNIKLNLFDLFSISVITVNLHNFRASFYFHDTFLNFFQQRQTLFKLLRHYRRPPFYIFCAHFQKRSRRTFNSSFLSFVGAFLKIKINPSHSPTKRSRKNNRIHNHTHSLLLS